MREAETRFAQGRSTELLDPIDKILVLVIMAMWNSEIEGHVKTGHVQLSAIREGKTTLLIRVQRLRRSAHKRGKRGKLKLETEAH